MSKIEKLIYQFKNLGIKEVPNGAILVGKAPHIAQDAWLNEIYPKLKQPDIDELEACLKTSIPIEYKKFLMNISNGLSIMGGVFTLDGLRREYDRSIEGSREPYSIEIPNVHERPINAKKKHFFIGGYNWDGSHLYIDTETNIVHYCDRWDVTSLSRWITLEDMVISEIKRIYSLYDSKGLIINEDKWTTPIER